ncbi:MAG: transporter substrate-binding protein [Actinomycetia bacterium]|nr:transporter substrate-binding protein [Actinomycetes bacterium]
MSKLKRGGVVRRSGPFFAVLCTLAVVSAACGSSSTGSGSTGTTNGTGTTSASGGAFTLAKPLKIVGFWEIKGESTVAIDDFQNAATLALDDVNKKGGVGGKPVELVRVANPVLDPQKAVAAYLKALDANPGVIIGGGGSTNAISQQVARGGVALVSPDTNANVEFGAKQGSDNMWLFSGGQAEGWKAATRYAVEDLGLKKLGFMGYTIPFGSVARTAVKEQATASGATIVADEEMPLPAQDLTQQILAMRGANMIFDASYQNDNALQLRQTKQNNVAVPSMFQGGLTIAVNQKLVTGDVLNNAYAFADCDPLSADPAMTAFRDSYKTAHGSNPSYLAAITYDLVHFVAEVAKTAQSSDPGKMNSAIPNTHYDGICQKDYHADGAHLILHHPQILKFSSDGSWKSVKVYNEPDKNKGAS